MVQTDTTFSLTDGGKETEMIFLRDRMLNNFALFECLKDEEGKKKLTEMYESYLTSGVKKMDLHTPTWRCTTNHMSKMGYGPGDVEKYTAMGAQWVVDFKKAHPDFEITIAG